MEQVDQKALIIMLGTADSDLMSLKGKMKESQVGGEITINSIEPNDRLMGKIIEHQGPIYVLAHGDGGKKILGSKGNTVSIAYQDFANLLLKNTGTAPLFLCVCESVSLAEMLKEKWGNKREIWACPGSPTLVWNKNKRAVIAEKGDFLQCKKLRTQASNVKPESRLLLKLTGKKWSVGPAARARQRPRVGTAKMWAIPRTRGM